MDDHSLFLDANVLIDLLIRRDPFWQDALLIYNGAEKGLASLSCSSLSVVIAHYQLKRATNEQDTRARINILLSMVRVCAVTSEIIKEAIKSPIKDFEDAVQYLTALSAGADFIITRNQKDFVQGTLPAWSPAQYLKKYG